MNYRQRTHVIIDDVVYGISQRGIKHFLMREIKLYGKLHSIKSISELFDLTEYATKNLLRYGYKSVADRKLKEKKLYLLDI